MLTVKCYAKDQHDILVQLKVDSETALTYINQLGGTLSSPRAGSADERTVALVPRQEHNPASHSPAGVLNGTADEESRVMEARQDRLEIMANLTELVFSRTEEDDAGQAVLRKNRTQSFVVALSGAAHALLL